MKIHLIDYTGIGAGSWHAADILLFTKNTRLNMSPGLLEEIKKWPIEKKLEELEYMSNTIPSSWEFVEYTFIIQNCNRGFTHQLVRSRHASFAQQTMRILDVSGFTYDVGPSVEENKYAKSVYTNTMNDINSAYEKLLSIDGVKIEDARGVLPTNIHTNIVVKMNLRAIAELAVKRSSPRVQGQYREFVSTMVDLVIDAHPWASCFLKNKKNEAANKLYSYVNGDLLLEKNDVVKLIDIIRG